MTDERIKEIVDSIPASKYAWITAADATKALQQLRDEMQKEITTMLGEAWEACTEWHLKDFTFRSDGKEPPNKEESIKSIIQKHSV